MGHLLGFYWNLWSQIHACLFLIVVLYFQVNSWLVSPDQRPRDIEESGKKHSFIFPGPDFEQVWSRFLKCAISDVLALPLWSHRGSPPVDARRPLLCLPCSHTSSSNHAYKWHTLPLFQKTTMTVKTNNCNTLSFTAVYNNNMSLVLSMYHTLNTVYA